MIAGNSTLGGDANFGIAHFSVLVSSIVSPMLATGHFYVLKKHSAIHIGFIGGADSCLRKALKEQHAVTGALVKSNTAPCNCRKSVAQYYGGDQVFLYNIIVKFLQCSGRVAL